LQSRAPAVLRAIRRPTDLAALERGIRRLTRRGIRVTLDVMYGLPLQSEQDVLDSIAWGRRLRRVKVQCMQTLLLPGTELRERAAEWGLRAASRPPYGVLSTAARAQTGLTRAAVRRIEAFIRATPGLPADSPTARFAGRSLPDLFPERCRLPMPPAAPLPAAPGSRNRRALVFRGADLFAARAAIVRAARRAVRAEPDALWQFVIAPEAEEPLDLIDLLAAELRRLPPHWLDRAAGAALNGRLVSRRVFVLLRKDRRYDRSWTAAVEERLSELFY
jgi:hypothetical protein